MPQRHQFIEQGVGQASAEGTRSLAMGVGAGEPCRTLGLLSHPHFSFRPCVKSDASPSAPRPGCGDLPRSPSAGPRWVLQSAHTRPSLLGPPPCHGDAKRHLVSVTTLVPAK